MHTCAHKQACVCTHNTTQRVQHIQYTESTTDTYGSCCWVIFAKRFRLVSAFCFTHATLFCVVACLGCFSISLLLLVPLCSAIPCCFTTKFVCASFSFPSFSHAASTPQSAFWSRTLGQQHVSEHSVCHENRRF